MLDTPIRFGTLTLKNRLVMPPMHTGKSDAGRVTPQLAEYYHDRAAYSAPGLIVMEHSAVTEGGHASESQLLISDDTLIEGHRQLTEAIHTGGSRVIAQLNHAGSNGYRDCVSASDVPNPRGEGRAPRPLTVEEIRAVEDAFAAAAVRALRAGYDGVEIHCAHGYLLNQFYSPLTNRRTDAYGGCLENRLRITLETYEKVRAAVGADVPVAVRLGGADYLPGGSTIADAVAAAKLLAAAGADLIDLSGGMCGFVLKDRAEAGYFSDLSEAVRAAVDVPVLLTGGVHAVSEAETLLTAGKADLIGVGRALLRDAHWRENNP